MSSECNLLGSVSSQQKFEATDIKALGTSQLLDSPCYSSWIDQFYLENKRKIHPRVVRVCRPKRQEEKRNRDGEKERAYTLEHAHGRETWPFDSSFYMFFPPPGPALCM